MLKSPEPLLNLPLRDLLPSLGLEELFLSSNSARSVLSFSSLVALALTHQYALHIRRPSSRSSSGQ